MSRYIGIIGAMSEELEQLLSALTETATFDRGGFTLYRGLLAGKWVLVSQCGVGKVNAAALTQTLVLEGVTDVICTGVAGALAPGLKVGDVVISRDALQHDADVRTLGYPLGVVPGEPPSWSASEELYTAAVGAAEALGEPGVEVVLGRVVSGDQFIADPGRGQFLFDTFGGVCAEMEGAAVAQVCSRAGVPFVIIRSISDTAGDSAETDFRTFTPVVARRAKAVVRGLLERL